MNHYLQIALEFALTATLGAIIGWLGSRLKTRKSYDDAIVQGMRSLMRREILDIYEVYLSNNKHMTVSMKAHLDEVFTAYTTLNGNSTAKVIYEEICEDAILES